MSPPSPSPSSAELRFAPRALLRVAGAALVASLGAVLLIRAIAVAIDEIPADFGPLDVASVVSLTVIGVLVALLVALALNRFAARPVSAFLRLVPVALALSLIPDIVIWVGNEYPGAGAGAVLPLMAMHVSVASIVWFAFPRAGELAPHASLNSSSTDPTGA